MTDIPGTGKLNAQKKLEKEKTPIAQSQNISVVNVKQIKKGAPRQYKKENEWQHQLKNWVLIGSVASGVFAIFAIFNWRFLLLIPIGPITAYITWHVRRFLKKYEKSDVLFK